MQDQSLAVTKLMNLMGISAIFYNLNVKVRKYAYKLMVQSWILHKLGPIWSKFIPIKFPTNVRLAYIMNKLSCLIEISQIL